MDKYKQAQRDHEFVNEMLLCRDALTPIIDGEIERGHCVAGQSQGYGQVPGMRKTTLKDARAIAARIVFLINRAIDKFERFDH